MSQPDLTLSTQLLLMRSGIVSERGTIYRDDLVVAEIRDDAEGLVRPEEPGDDPAPWEQSEQSG